MVDDSKRGASMCVSEKGSANISVGVLVLRARLLKSEEISMCARCAVG